MEPLTFQTEKIYTVLAEYNLEASTISSLNKGHINQSWMVVLHEQKFLLQYINPFIFNSIPNLVRNQVFITKYLKTTSFWHELQTPELLATKNNEYYVVTENQHHWRVSRYIEHDTNYRIVDNENIAYQASRAYGKYLSCLALLPVNSVVQTILNFQDPVARMIQFGEAINSDPVRRKNNALPEIDFLRKNIDIARKISDLILGSIIPTRITHNNTNIDNLLWKDGRVVAIVDLDTTMPSSVLYDFGEMVRTFTTPFIDSNENTSVIQVNRLILDGVVDGFLSIASNFILPSERRALYKGALMVVYIQAVRYLTDFLLGDKHYPTVSPDHNLKRVRNHIELYRQLKSLESTVRSRIE